METLTTEIRDSIGIITLNRPKANAINTEMVEELDAEFWRNGNKENRLTAITLWVLVRHLLVLIFRK